MQEGNGRSQIQRQPLNPTANAGGPVTRGPVAEGAAAGERPGISLREMHRARRARIHERGGRAEGQLSLLGRLAQRWGVDTTVRPSPWSIEEVIYDEVGDAARYDLLDGSGSEVDGSCALPLDELTGPGPVTERLAPCVGPWRRPSYSHMLLSSIGVLVGPTRACWPHAASVCGLSLVASAPPAGVGGICTSCRCGWRLHLLPV
ncbi:hypothetical protein CYMTET_28993 [Cymbomonas tetramitiformis]|uniref:Uncharacterized protein n=1 Tax=Cymbomonas tetramitiformis TaxID=36881 RepID=A0AAE0FLP7_9CHLO|nr:hypothetical protein CYMTET_28993 [Cymbomonas tetramitiformis]